MDPSTRIYELFSEVAEQPVEDREAFLLTLARREPTLARALTSLVAQLDEMPEGFLGADVDEAAAALQGVEQVGPYRVVRPIGRGAMGVVFEAEQAQPRRRVALKVLRRREDRPDLAARFEREAEVLGRLNHPGIAHVYAAGSHRVGATVLPYIAMELLEGRTLDAFLAERRPLQERLRIFAEICDAVEHAHRLDVVHRDLKPSNILVVESEDGAVRPKVLDFGIAQVQGVDLETLERTQTGFIMGTLGYMSPEQLRGGRAVDVRSDVYALGVILYQLLVGRLPYDVENRPIPEVVRRLTDEEPEPLTLYDASLRGDLETIVHTAIDKDPARRYASAAAFAADIRRYLDHEPIAARPPSLGYRVGKFTRRHRFLVVAVGSIVAALVVGITISISALFEARRERDRKEAALEASDQVTRFLSEVVQWGSPFSAEHSPASRALVERSQAFALEFPDRPEVEARLRTAFSRTFKELRLYDDAIVHLEAAQRAWASLENPPVVDRAETWALLGTVYMATGRPEEADRLTRRAVEAVADRTPTAEDRILTIFCRRIEFLVRAGREAEARAALARATAIERRGAADPNEPGAFELQYLRGFVELVGGAPEAAVAPLETWLNRSLRRNGPRHPETAAGELALAQALARTPRKAEAGPLLQNALKTFRDVLGPWDGRTVSTTQRLARFEASEGRVDEGLARIEDLVERWRAAFPAKEVPAYVLDAYGKILRRAGRWADSVEALEAAIRIDTEAEGRTSAAVQMSAVALLETLVLQDDPAALAKWVRIIETEILVDLPADHPRRQAVQAILERGPSPR